MTSPYAELQLARDGDIAILTLDNPARLNPISHTLQNSLVRAIADLAADDARGGGAGEGRGVAEAQFGREF